ncbi:MAG: efflux RND transporter periplasmic adaptor subunit [Phycisphaerae bacterium]
MATPRPSKYPCRARYRVEPAAPGQAHRQLVDQLRRRTAASWPTLVAVSLILILGGGWSLATLTRHDRSTQKDDVFVVTPRSFLVELHEKGELKAAKSVDIKSAVEGRSTIISVIPEGTAVEKGDLLVEIASDQLADKITQEELKEATALSNYEAAKVDLEIQKDRNASDIRKAVLDVKLKNLSLEKYEQGDWAEQQHDAQIKIEEARLSLERAAKDFESAGQLRDKGFYTQIEYEQDEFAHKKAKWELEKAILAKKVLEDYTRKADLAKQESDRDEAVKELERITKNAKSEEQRKTRNLEGKEKELEITRTRLAKLREQFEKCRITAPAPGFVVYYSAGGRYWSSDGSGQIKEGATVYERQILMQLPDTSEMLVTVRIHEAKTDKIKLGQSAIIEVEGIPEKQFSGKVTKIAVVADTQNRWLNPDLKEYETEITLDPTEVPLKPGVTAHCRILVEEVVDKLAVPVQAVYSKAGHNFVFKSQGATVEPVEIELGSVAAEWAQITKGIQEGDPVLLAFTDDHLRLISDLSPATPPDAEAFHAQGRRSTGAHKRGASGKKSNMRKGRGAARRGPHGHGSKRG